MRFPRRDTNESWPPEVEARRVEAFAQLDQHAASVTDASREAGRQIRAGRRRITIEEAEELVLAELALRGVQLHPRLVSTFAYVVHAKPSRRALHRHMRAQQADDRRQPDR